MTRGTTHRTLKHKVRKDMELKFYKIMAKPMLLYGGENWTLKESEEDQLREKNVFCLQKFRDCTLLDKLRNVAIKERTGKQEYCG